MALEDQHDTFMKQIMEKLLLLIPPNRPPPFPWVYDHPFYRFELTFTTNEPFNEYTFILGGNVGDDRNYESGTIAVLDVDEIRRGEIHGDVLDITRGEYNQIMGYIEDPVYKDHKIEADEDAYYDHNRGLNQNNETGYQNEQTIPNHGDQRVPTRGGDWHGWNQYSDYHNVPSITCTPEGYLFKNIVLS